MLKHRAFFLGLMAVLVAGFALGGEAIPNWPAPATWTPPRSAGVHTMTDISLMEPFIAVTPCRIWDTRGNGFVGAYGPPSIGANTQRTFVIVGASGCGIPASAVAVSFNIGALNVSAAGDLRVFPAGGAVPLVSTLNYNANTPNIANAAVVPLGTGGAITLQADGVGIDSIGDVNGYYASIPATLTSPFIVENAGAVTIAAGNGSTASGVFAVDGVILSSTPGGNSTGVRGINNGTAGSGIGVWGSQAGNGWGGLFQALGTTGGDQFGAIGEANSNASSIAGVLGEALATTGANYGVWGFNSSVSDTAAGVYGTARGGLAHIFFGQVGVLGDNGCLASCNGDWGVLGISLGRGVQGSRTDSAGNFQNSGVLGYTGTIGVFSFTDYGGIGAKYFIEPHPTDAAKQINYISLEGPEAGTYFRGRGAFVGGQAVIPVPEDFRLVTEEEGLTVQITPIGRMAQVGVVSMDLNNIVAAGSRDVEFSYLVQGVRKGYADVKPIQENVIFVPSGPDDRMGPYPERIRQRLVSLGIYNGDGTVNMETARRLGWDKVWQAAAEKAKAAAAKKAPTESTSQQ